MSGFDDPFWTPEQVIAWIAFKDRALVDATSAAELRKLQAMDKNGHIRLHERPLNRYLRGQHPGSQMKRNFFGALDELLKALQTGGIVASHRPKGSGERIEASKFYWIDHDLGANYWGIVCSMSANKRLDTYDDEVRFDATQVKKIWPIPSNYAAVKMSADKKAYDTICSMMKASPNKRPKPKAEIIADLLKEIPGLKKTAAETQWTRAAEDTGAYRWTLPGRPANEQ